MRELTREKVRDDLFRLIQEIQEEWDLPTDVTEQTGLFRELGFESIDAVALGSSIEEKYQQSIPFASFLTEASEQNWPDIKVGQLVDFLLANLDGSPERSGG